MVDDEIDETVTPAPEDDKLPDGVQPRSDGGVNILSGAAYKNLKDKAREQGRRAAISEYDLRIKALEEKLMAQAVGGNGGAGGRFVAAPTNAAPPPGDAPPRDPGPAPDNLSRRAQAAWNKEREKIITERDKWQQRATQWEKRYHESDAQLRHRDITLELHKSAWQSGIKDTDYAIALLDREVDRLSEDELKAFDERKYFEGLRDTRPYLFGENTQPANTGTSGNVAPPAPKPGEVQQRQAVEGQVDVRKMKPDEYQAYLRKRNLNPLAAG